MLSLLDGIQDFCSFSKYLIRNGYEMCMNSMWPPMCLICKEITDTQGVCVSCWSSITWLQNDASSVIVQGHGDPLKVYAAMEYDALSKHLFLALKMQDKTHIAPYLAQLMIQKFAHVFLEYDYIVPVPMHRWSLIKRTYNQSAIIAMHIWRKLRPCPIYAPSMLRKTKMTARQMRLSQSARLRNVRNAFSVSRDITGAKILLIDDVMTTGATMYECTKALLKSGASDVGCMVVARVL